MSIRLIDNSSQANGLTVNADHEAAVALTLTSSKAGFATAAAEKGVTTVGSTRVIREMEVSDDYRLRVELDNPLHIEFPIGTTLNTKKWKTTATTQTVTVANARIELNSSGINTLNTGSMIQTYRTFSLMKAAALYGEFECNWSLDPVANWTAEWGFGNASTYNGAHVDGAFFRLTQGVFRGVVANNSVETYVDLGTLPNAAEVGDYIIEVTQDAVYFWKSNVLLNYVLIPATQYGVWSVESVPLMIRTYNGATTPSVAIKFQCGTTACSLGGMVGNRLWATVKSAMGDSAIQAPTGTATAQTANYANTAAPASATLSNTAAGYTTLGGQFQFAAVAGAETDYALFGYQVPTGKTLIIRGVWIDTMNTGAAVATTATWLQWGLGIGSTAVSLATTDAATTKAPARILLGNQVFPIAAAIGAQAQKIDVNLDAPLVVNSGEFFHVILKMPLGTATASQIIRGIVGVNGYFE